jgi:DNA-binding Lrp family transcriptional regulator
MSHYQNAGQNQNISIAIKSFEIVVDFKHLGTTVTYKNYMQIKIRSSLNSGNAFCPAVQKPLSSHLLPKNIRIEIYRTTVVPVSFYGHGTWFLTLKD